MKPKDKVKCIRSSIICYWDLEGKELCDWLTATEDRGTIVTIKRVCGDYLEFYDHNFVHLKDKFILI